MVPSSPTSQRGRVVLLGDTGVGDEPFLGHIELAAQRPIRRLGKVGRRVLRRNRDHTDVDARILGTLQLPRAFPLGTHTHPVSGVAPGGKERDRFGRDEFGDQCDQVDVATAIQLGNADKVGVGAGEFGERAGGHDLLRRPEPGCFQPVEQPAAQRTLHLRIPRLRRPPPLALGPLDQRDVTIRLDLVDAPRDQFAIRLGPVGGDLGDRRGAMPHEPRRLQLARLDLTGHHDLERPLPQRNRRHLIQRERKILTTQQVIEAVDVPVELLLRRDHPLRQLQRRPMGRR